MRFALPEQEAAKLAQEVFEKLEEAEEQCRESLQTEWEECRPCLEDACKNFYTSTCRRGFATFHTKAWKYLKIALSTAASHRKTISQEKHLPKEIRLILTQVFCWWMEVFNLEAHPQWPARLSKHISPWYQNINAIHSHPALYLSFGWSAVQVFEINMIPPMSADRGNFMITLNPFLKYCSYN